MDFNLFLFDDFETLDVFGPAELFGMLPEYKLRFLSQEGGLITSRQGAQIMTEPAREGDFSGLLLIPGGLGTRPLLESPAHLGLLKEMAEESAYCLTVCTGSALLAKTGLLKGRRATSNKSVFEWVKTLDSEVHWVERARWVVDGKYYTSSGVSAGMDMSLGFIAEHFGRERAEDIAVYAEYIWNDDSQNDPFAKK